jgi:hypothetical protein
MGWPIESDYFGAVQNPQICFTDPELKTGEVTKTKLGLPKPITGAFASVYQVRCPTGRTWAVRCFLRDIPDQQNRYSAISAHLKSANLPYTIGFDYLRDGIRVNGKSYPILKMEWLDGVPLNGYIEQHLSRPHDLQALARRWIDMMAALKRADMAHGDLQHGNIIVSNGNLKLIDYDGMYVPALARMHSNEVGQPNYQHPKRSGSDFNAQLDNFSAWVIFISLSAFAIEPSLWTSLNCGDENLLFRRKDFDHPNTSKIFRALDSSGKPQLKSLADQMRSLVYLPLSQIPTLDGVAVGAQPRNTTSGVPDWLSDHIVEEKLEPLHEHQSPNSVVAAADWIFDHLVDSKPLPPILHSLSLATERLMLACVLAVALATIILLICWTQSVWPPAAAGTSSAFIVYGFLWARYRSLGVVAEKRSVLAEVSEGHQKLSQVEATSNLIRVEQQRAMEPLLAADQKYRTIPQRLRQSIREVQGELNETLGKIEERARYLDQKQEQDLHDVDSQGQQWRLELERERDGYWQSEQHERDRILQAMREQHVYSQLRSHRLVNAVIAGIGPKLRDNLRDKGIYSAAEIDSRIYSVAGIGDAKADALSKWRILVEQQANYTAPTEIPESEVRRLRTKYETQNSLIEKGIADSGDWQMQQRTAIAQNFVRYRQQLIQEEAAAKQASDKRVEALQIEAQIEKERLSKSFQELKVRTDSIRKELDSKLMTLSQSTFQRRAELHRLGRELSRYDAVSFGQYLKLVLGTRRAVVP